MTRYADAEAFARMFKTGKRPDGTPVKVMPFGSLGAMSDVDVRACSCTSRPAGESARLNQHAGVM
jgi:hypothetical protein